MARPAIEDMLAFGDRVARSWQLWLERAPGSEPATSRARRRLRTLVRHARAHAPYFRERCRGLPDDAPLARLPVTTKPVLMAHFDDWVADRGVRLADVRRFVADPARVGERFRGRYLVWRSSGTSGVEGLFLQDDGALAVYDALLGHQLAAPDITGRCIAGGWLRGGRAALVTATGGHYAGVAAWQRVSRASPLLRARVFPVTLPLPALVAALDAYAPAFVASYPTMLALLAAEQRAGRLRLAPTLLWSGGESLSPALHREIERTFGCPVIEEYGASECLSIGFGCREHWIHVNEDWVIVEPVEADGSPTPPGRTSSSVLLTNLANFIQPIVRYDLGDAVTMRTDPCPCGNPLPAMRIEGRRDDIVALHDGRRVVRIAPMALATVVETATGLHRFQVVQRGPHELALRVAGGDAATRAAGEDALRRYLASVGAGATSVVGDATPPQSDPRSGKVRQVVIERADGH